MWVDVDPAIAEVIEQVCGPMVGASPAGSACQTRGYILKDLSSSDFIPDLGPEVYDKWRSSQLGRTTERLEWQTVLKLLGDVNGLRILDLGCGDGTFAIELARRGAEVIGIDASRSMIEAACRRSSAQNLDVVFYQAKADAIPFAEGTFDAVVAITILCFVRDATPEFREIGRVLRPGGRLVIGELGRWSSWAASRRIRAWLGSPLWRRAKFRTPGELRMLAQTGGLIPGTVQGAIFYPKLGLAASLLAPIDNRIGRKTTLGAAFLTLAAKKPD